MLVFAAHQDDCVIEAGGLAIQNIKLGGEVNIVYLTRPIDQKAALIRKEEAYAAWKLLDSKKIKLSFLDYDSRKVWPEQDEISARGAILSTIEKNNPDLIVIPLKEGGHPEHDLLNALVLDVMTRFPTVEVLQAAEYNPYYIMEHTPTKFLWFLVRLLPFAPYNEPNYGLVPENQMHLRMSRDELDMKIKMLLVFKSQKNEIPLTQFAYADLFEATLVPPSNVWFIIGKYWSLWSILTLFLTFLMCWSWGFASVFKFSRTTNIIIVMIALYLVIFSLMTEFKMMFYESLYGIAFFVGIMSGKILGYVEGLFSVARRG
jgi:LmbE family N-acetylglucosaminyl deacetylase